MSSGEESEPEIDLSEFRSRQCDHSIEFIAETIQRFKAIHFEKINDSWASEMLSTKFSHFEECNISSDTLFSTESVRTLAALIQVCETWVDWKHAYFDYALINRSLDPFQVGRRNSSSIFVLWEVMTYNDIHVKNILSFIFLLCSRSIQRSSTMTDKVLGLFCSQLYLVLLRVPGSVSHSVFHQNLYRLCLHCLNMREERRLTRKHG